MIRIVYLLVIAGLVLAGCKQESAEEKLYKQTLKAERMQKDYDFKNNPDGPFQGEGSTPLTHLKYYDIDMKYVVKSKLSLFPHADSVTIYGTKGEPRPAFKVGTVQFAINSVPLKLTVYKSISRTGEEYYSLWFTDKTTGNETYGVGRYIEFEYNPDPEYLYTIDFNRAFNPYCAYNHRYSCAVPTKDNYLDVAIEAGEKKYHED